MSQKKRCQRWWGWGGWKSVECWWTFEHFYMPEGIPLTTLIKVIIGAIGACQMPSLPSQLPRSPWTQLLTSSWRPGGRRRARRRWGPGTFNGKGGRSIRGITRTYGKCPPTGSAFVNTDCMPDYHLHTGLQCLMGCPGVQLTLHVNSKCMHLYIYFFLKT